MPLKSITQLIITLTYKKKTYLVSLERTYLLRTLNHLTDLPASFKIWI